MRRLLAYSSLTPLALAAAISPLQAQRSIDGAVTSPVATSTANNGAAADISITANGSVAVTGGAAVTIDSNNDVANAGKITINNASNATGILAQAGRTADIANTGTISILEDYTPTDTDKDGDLDGPFAQGSNRFGIRVGPGGTFAGAIANSGTITIEGNDSAGIAIDSQLAGSLNQSGTIAVTGDRSYGLRAGDISGNVRIAGAISANGDGAIGAALDGNIGGALVIQGAITSTGYRSLPPPADTSKLDADDLLQGGPALRISGNVAGGIVFAVPPPDKDPKNPDEDNDGLPDATEGSASVTSRGAAPAVQIGSTANAIAIGPVAGNANGYGLVIDGAIAGAGTYAGVDGNGLVIGGLGGNVTIAGGMAVNGSLSASSNGADATALRIGSGASVATVQVTGKVGAAGGTDTGDLSQAILIDQGASVSAIRNSGTISANGGTKGSATAIVDRSGGVGLIENSGTIAASGASAIAIDLSANTSGAIVRQTEVEQGATPPAINGGILFGTGNDRLEIADGAVSGATSFGAGDDTLSLAGDAAYRGNVAFGAGADHMILAGQSTFAGNADFGGGANLLEVSGTASFLGGVANGAGLDVRVAGGRFQATNLGSVALSSIDVTGGGTLGVSIDGAAGTNTHYDIAGTASFAAGSHVQVRLANISQSAGRYQFLSAGTLSGGGNLTFDSAGLPFLFKGALEADGNDLAVIISRKSAAELGLNGSATRAYDAIFAALDNDSGIGSVFLGIADSATLRAEVGQMLPDHAGGAFETVTMASRTTARFLADPNAPVADLGGGWGLWLQQVAWGTSKNLGDTAAYDVNGWGANGALERRTGLGSFGLSLAYLAGQDANGENDNEVRADQFELAGYWRIQAGGLHAYARASAARINFDSVRAFSGIDLSGNEVDRTSEANWHGWLYSAAAGLSYELRFGRVLLRPGAGIDYYRLAEGGFAETGGSDSFDLTVGRRTSDELAGTANLSLGYEFGSRSPNSIWVRTEIEGGRRQILSGRLGATTAQFANGDPFTLEPGQRSSGWEGALRVIGGGGITTVAAEAHAEEQNGRASIGFRVSVGFGF